MTFLGIGKLAFLKTSLAEKEKGILSLRLLSQNR